MKMIDAINDLCEKFYSLHLLPGDLFIRVSYVGRETRVLLLTTCSNVFTKFGIYVVYSDTGIVRRDTGYLESNSDLKNFIAQCNVGDWFASDEGAVYATRGSNCTKVRTGSRRFTETLATLRGILLGQSDQHESFPAIASYLDEKLKEVAANASQFGLS